MLRLRFALVLGPLLVWALMFLIQRLRRKPITRAHVTVGLSVLVLLYFLGVVGTGLFWVAAQELPVFDWHYLPGYVLLLLTLAHVALHWRTILAFLRRQSPDVLVAPERNRFKGWIGKLGWTGLGLVGAGLCFLLGMRQGSGRITVEGGHAATLPALPGAAIAPTAITAEGQTLPLSRYYHEGSSYPARTPLPGLTLAARPELYLAPTGPATPLPTPGDTPGPSVLAATETWRQGTSTAHAKGLSLASLGRMLWAAQGVSETLERRGRSFDLRTSPSAGALYPVNVYVLAQAVEGLEPGLYYHHPKRGVLIQVKDDPMALFGALQAAGQAKLASPASLVFTTTFARTAFKYGERSYRYVAMDTGHVAYQAALAASAEGWKAPLVARFDDRALNTALGVDSSQEAAMLVMPLTEGPLAPPSGFQKDLSPTSKSNILNLVHGGTSLRLGGNAPASLPARTAFQPCPGDVALPAPAEGLNLLSALKKRRSVRSHTAQPMTREELSALCKAAQGPVSGGDPLLTQTAPLGLYAVVRDVKGLPSGVYRYVAGTHALQLVKAGDFGKACMDACLQQDFCGTADVVFIKTVRWKELLVPDGDRGYRYANLLAGVQGGGLYLEGAALGLGVCGVGAFEDPAVAALVGLDLQDEVPLYVTAVGR